ncbi:tyrosine-protein kinase receptor torso-like [Phymastichus coffea]|uniref:tyrosine-protein kinase receptor torso-like n=1 Tax=Phymastichus coffea TaxID=108790 RepID=UPI00273BE434|nr:tyrosine-protein kinase receptor torso-like [Phymastichus coffea]
MANGKTARRNKTMTEAKGEREGDDEHLAAARARPRRQPGARRSPGRHARARALRRGLFRRNIPRLGQPSLSNVSLQCKDSNRLVIRHNPGLYVIERQSKGSDIWTHPEISSETIHESLGLSDGAEYRYRASRVSAAGVARPDVTPWFRTHGGRFVPGAAKGVSIGRIEASDEQSGPLRAELHIVPPDDLNCLYHIVHWAEGHELHHYQFDAKRGFRYELNRLRYGRSHTVYVISRNERDLRESANVTLTFATPSCLGFHHNLSICAPARTTGVGIVEQRRGVNTVDLTINWDEPAMHPDNYTIVVQPVDCDNCSVEISVFGNETAAKILGLSYDRQYKIGIIAESEGGSSFEWTLFSAARESSIAGMHPAVAVSALATLFIFGMIVCTLCRCKKLGVHYCHYNFFEDIGRNGVTLDVIKSPLKSSLGYDLEESSKTKDKFEIAADRLRVKKILGSGIGGIVKLATLQDDQKRTYDVAVKVLREDASAEDVRNFHREILLMKSAGNHPNIVSLIGCCTISKYPVLIVEYCSKGDLLSYLKQMLEETTTAFSKQIEWPAHTELSPFLPQENANSSCAINNRLYDVQTAEALIESKISPKDLLNFARQVASGMEFLSSNRIVHRDLAARNVLVCADRTVKISDFGLSRDIYQENVYKKQGDGKLPFKWMAIEALTHQVYTSQSDVWSFGILLYEIVTLGGNPYPALEAGEILHLLKSGYRMERPSNCGSQLYELMRLCWHENPMKRPSFNELKLHLDKLISTMASNEYLNLTVLLREPHFRQFGAFERKDRNILMMPSIT